MLVKIKNNIKNFIPPILLKFLKPKSKYGWFGSYQSWSDAQNRCSGYDSDIILEKCLDAALKVKNGEALFERDSVLFYKADYSWLILSGLLHCAVENNGKLDVIDFGGSLGSSYYQNLKFLSSIKNLSLFWNVVEQKRFIELGNKYFQNQNLKFYETIENCLKVIRPNVLLLSSVLQYLESPFEWLDKFLALNIEYIVIDKTAFSNSSSDIISIQKVSPDIYNASYPAWIFSEKKFLSNILVKYDLILEHCNSDESNYRGMYFKGYIFKLKK